MLRQPEEKKAKNILLDKRIREKISGVQDLFELWGDALRKDPPVFFLLNSLDKKIAASREAMEVFGVTSACRHCLEDDGATCCGAGIENRYTSRLLLINLLLGKALPQKRLWEN